MPDPTVKAPEGQTSTTTSTSVLVPAPIVQQPQKVGYDEWGVIGLVFGCLVIILTVCGGVITIIDHFRKRRQDQKEAEKEKDAPLENRVSKIESLITNFRTVEDLEKDFDRLMQKVDHNKENSTMGLSGLNGRIDRIHDRVNEEASKRVRLETQIESMLSNTQRIETSIERQGERIDERFDKLHELISSVRNNSNQ